MEVNECEDKVSDEESEDRNDNKSEQRNFHKFSRIIAVGYFP